MGLMECVAHRHNMQVMTAEEHRKLHEQAKKDCGCNNNCSCGQSCDCHREDCTSKNE